MTISSLGPLADHLWQSTLVAAVVAALTLALKHNRAQVRHALWLAASLKFLLPFAALVALGQQIEWPQGTASVQPVLTIVDSVGQPFSASASDNYSPRTIAPRGPSAFERTVPLLVGLWALGSTVFIAMWIHRWRVVASTLRRAGAITAGRVVEAVRRIEANRLPTALRIVSCDSPMEPGVCGWRSPVLLWPHGIEDRLSDAQIDAILAHEIAHVRRHDNLTSALHMTVQAIFWFHPLTWWIGARLVDERERACDEDVVRAGSRPDVYAESILKTCQYFVESPLTCVAGVTGSDLKKRIEQIMRPEAHAALNASKRILLGAALFAATAGPVAVGVLMGARLSAQVVAPAANAPTFDVASVKPNNSGPGRMGGRGGPGRLDMTNMPLRRLIRQAYDIHETQIIGGPDWLDSQGFDVTATFAGDQSPERRRAMMQTLLRDRFKLTFHAEKRDMPIYALVMARTDKGLGEGLRKTEEGACLPRGAGLPAAPSTSGPPPAPPSPFDPDARAACGSIVFGPGRLFAHGVPIDMLANALGNLPAITAFNRIVQNQTGLEGTYDFDFKFANEAGGRGGPFIPPPGAGAVAATPGDEPVLFTALQEQLGLKLDARRSNVEVMVIDSVEKPDPN
jgi:bla regulator protein blaR1